MNTKQALIEKHPGGMLMYAYYCESPDRCQCYYKLLLRELRTTAEPVIINIDKIISKSISLDSLQKSTYVMGDNIEFMCDYSLS